MPKKTRKDKIMAQRRRQSAILPHTAALPKANSIAPTYTFAGLAEKKKQQIITERSVELIAIQRDLFKTIVLAIVAFGVELSIYWLLKH